MAERLRRPRPAGRRASAHGQGDRTREARSLPGPAAQGRAAPAAGGGGAMLDPAVRCVVGIDVAKHSRVVCALEAPTGAVRQRALKIEATAAGDAGLGAQLARWGTPPALLVGLEATGC